MDTPDSTTTTTTTGQPQIIQVQPAPQPSGEFNMAKEVYGGIQSGAFAVLLVGGGLFWVMRTKLFNFLDSHIETNKGLQELAKKTVSDLEENRRRDTQLLDEIQLTNKSQITIHAKLEGIEKDVREVRSQLDQLL